MILVHDVLLRVGCCVLAACCKWFGVVRRWLLFVGRCMMLVRSGMLSLVECFMCAVG